MYQILNPMNPHNHIIYVYNCLFNQGFVCCLLFFCIYQLIYDLFAIFFSLAMICIYNLCLEDYKNDTSADMSVMTLVNKNFLLKLSFFVCSVMEYGFQPVFFFYESEERVTEQSESLVHTSWDEGSILCKVQVFFFYQR